MFSKEIFNFFFKVEILSDTLHFFIKRFCIEFHEEIILALILKRPYF